MADTDLPALVDPDRTLALGYVPAVARAHVRTLWMLDERLALIVARAGEPTLALMRLIWWRDALEALDERLPPAEPLLRACARLPGMRGHELAAMIGGWEAVLEDPELSDDTLAAHGWLRGATLFTLAASLLAPAVGEAASIERAGEGWAYVDLARLPAAHRRAAAMRARAEPPLAASLERRWPRGLRPLGALAATALAEARGLAGPRARALRILRHHLTGR